LVQLVIIVVITAVITPALLKLAFHSQDSYDSLAESLLVNRIETALHLETVSMKLLEKDSDMQPFTKENLK